MKKYLTDAHSALGYINLQQDNLVGVDTVFYLSRCHDNLADFILVHLAQSLEQEGYTCERVYSASNLSRLSAVILRDKGIGFVSGVEAPLDAIVIDFSSAYGSANDPIIAALRQEMDAHYQDMYAHLYRALRIHDDWEHIYIENMDFKKANQFKANLIKDKFNAPAKPVPGLIMRRFFGGVTPTRYMDFVDDISRGLKRYFIKGRAGTGKSTLMRGIADYTSAQGYDTELYHCGFDPNSIDMVLIPELGVCIFDATLPHEYDPSEPTDEVIDTYVAYIKEGTDETYQGEIAIIAHKYKDAIADGVTCLGKAAALREEINQLYDQVLDMDVALRLFSECMRV